MPMMRGGRRRKKCKPCDFMDYKDVNTLRRHMSATGKIHSRKRAQACQKCQRLVKQAVKRARFMAIFPHTASGRGNIRGL